MKTLDWKKELKHLYHPSAREVAQVEVPAMNFLKIDGKGDPNTAQEYADASKPCSQWLTRSSSWSKNALSPSTMA